MGDPSLSLNTNCRQLRGREDTLSHLSGMEARLDLAGLNGKKKNQQPARGRVPVHQLSLMMDRSGRVVISYMNGRSTIGYHDEAPVLYVNPVDEGLQRG